MDLMLYRTAELAPLQGEPQTVQHHLLVEHSLRAIVGPFPRINRCVSCSARAYPASRSYRPAAYSGLPIRVLAEYCQSYPLDNQISLPKLWPFLWDRELLTREGRVA